MTRRRTSMGAYGHTVAIERRGARLYLRWWDQTARAGRGGYTRASLGHDDRQRAEAEARRLAGELLAANRAALEGKLTVGMLLGRYERDVVDAGQVARPAEYRRRIALWESYLGPDRDVRTIDRPTLDRFVQLRAAGKLAGEGLGPVGARTTQADLELLRAVMNWAVATTLPNGRPLLEASPLQGYRLPTRSTARRPIATYDRFLALRAVADQVDPQHRFGALLDLVEALGWRVSALCRLRGEDIDRQAHPGTPHGRIHRRAETDKERVDQWIPLSAELRAHLDRLAVLGGWLFPARRDPSRPWSRRYATSLLMRAEQAAGLPHLAGGAFHPYRRKWAVERKGLSVIDVAAAGGWKTPRVVQEIYQQTDEATLLAVVSCPAKLREAIGVR